MFFSFCTILDNIILLHTTTAYIITDMPAATISPKTLPPGVYCPTITFFEPTAEQNLDVETHVKHMEFLAKSGLAGVVVQGSTAEAVTLDDEERKTVCIKTVVPP